MRNSHGSSQGARWPYCVFNRIFIVSTLVNLSVCLRLDNYDPYWMMDEQFEGHRRMARPRWSSLDREVVPPMHTVGRGMPRPVKPVSTRLPRHSTLEVSNSPSPPSVDEVRRSFSDQIFREMASRNSLVTSQPSKQVNPRPLVSLADNDDETRQKIDVAVSVDLISKFEHRNMDDELVWKASFFLEPGVNSAFLALSMPRIFSVCHPNIISVHGSNITHSVNEGDEFHVRSISQKGGLLLQRIVVGETEFPKRLLFHQGAVFTVEGAARIDDLKNIGKSFQHTIEPTARGTTKWTLTTALYNCYPNEDISNRTAFAKVAREHRASSVATDEIFGRCVQKLLTKPDWHRVLDDTD
eukprot:TRINITY_DN67129_c0_g1_i1.p1 TRINITY_DN67129_c0_g1~~TRINITY_DN67129_c0_g1_i1.p1  ORF type:complete len:354 (+),score=31.56 TRINITY_DN67129_c0_g1_i1:79-1140(+)